MMLVFAGFVAGVLVWLPMGWVMRGDSYVRHYVPVPVPAQEPAPVLVAALAARVPEVHVHLTMPAAAPAPMVIQQQPARWEIEG